MPSSFRRLAIASLACACGALASCGGDSTGPGAAMTVVVTASSAAVLPGGIVGCLVTVTAAKDVTVDSLTIVASGALTSTETIPVGVAGTFTASRSFQVPLRVGTGALTITASARAGGSRASGETRVAVADSTQPHLGVTMTPQTNSLESGDSVLVSLQASDAAALLYTVVRASGSFAFTDSADASYASNVQRTVKIQIPANASLTTALKIDVVTANVGGVVTTQSLPILTVVDTAHPAVTGSLTTTHSAGGAAPGDHLTLTVTGTDRRKLAYVGYSFGAPANVTDSVATSQATYTSTIPIIVPANWTGTSSYSVFARDSVGNRTSVVLGALTVASRTRRAIVSAAKPGAIRDATFDAKRNLIYMSLPSQQQVAVLSMADMTFGTPFAFGASPHGLDVTPGGDSLVVALVETPNVAIINLPSKATTMMPVTSGNGPDFLRIASTNKVLVTLTFAGSGYGGSLVEADLATGATHVLNTVTEYVPIAMSGNRTRLIALIDDSCCPEEAFVYDALSGKIIGDGGTVSNYFNWVSADFSGNAFMVQSSVFASTVRQTTAYGGNLYTGGPSQLSSDGLSGYFATTTGVVHVRFSDGALLDNFNVGEAPSGIWMSRDGLTLFVAGTSHVYVIDLW